MIKGASNKDVYNVLVSFHVTKLPSQILLKLGTYVPNETRKSWKFQLQNFSSSKNIGIQS